MKCEICGFVVTNPDELVAITDDPQSINDFVHCPICRSNVWGEASEAVDMTMTEHQKLAIEYFEHQKVTIFFGGQVVDKKWAIENIAKIHPFTSIDETANINISSDCPVKITLAIE